VRYGEELYHSSERRNRHIQQQTAAMLALAEVTVECQGDYSSLQAHQRVMRAFEDHGGDSDEL
jgi:hypothetical protein